MLFSPVFATFQSGFLFRDSRPGALSAPNHDRLPRPSICMPIYPQTYSLQSMVCEMPLAQVFCFTVLTFSWGGVGGYLNSLPLRSANSRIFLIHPLYFHTLADSFPQRRARNSFFFYRLRTLSIATGGVTPSRRFPLIPPSLSLAPLLAALLRLVFKQRADGVHQGGTARSQFADSLPGYLLEQLLSPRQ